MNYLLHFDDRPDDGPTNVGPFPTREAAFAHATTVIAGGTGSYEAWPITPPIADLIERSSLGTPAAKAARASVPDDVAARVVARARELEPDAEWSYLLACHHTTSAPAPFEHRTCPVTFTWNGTARDHDHARNQAFTVALTAGWTIEQAHDGSVFTECPGEGTLPPHLTTSGRRNLP